MSASRNNQCIFTEKITIKVDGKDDILKISTTCLFKHKLLCLSSLQGGEFSHFFSILQKSPGSIDRVTHPLLCSTG